MNFPEARLTRLLPFLAWWPMVDRGTLRADFLAALTGAIVVLPQGVAFAVIAGMPAQYGLYAAMVPAIVAALFGSSWHLVSGPTTAASLVLFASLSGLAEPGSAEYIRLALTLTFLVGITQLVMGLVRMGTLVNFISHSVVIGFTAGAAILIAVNQVKHFFGLEMPRGLDFFHILREFALHAGDIDPWVTTVSAATLLLGILVKRFWPKIPYMIAALLAGSLVSVAFGAFAGVHIATVGALPASLPPLSAPDLSLGTLKSLAPAVLAVTLLALTEAVSIARSIAVRSGQHISGNQEFIGQGLSNVAGSFFSAYVATGSFNRSGVNYEAGAKTPLSSVMAAFILMALVLLVAPLAAYLPNAAMAGILMLVAWGLIDFHHIHKIIQTSLSETTVMGVTFGATLLLDLEFAILLGVFLSLVVYLSRTSQPAVHTRVPDPRVPNRSFVSDRTLPECPQMKILRIDGSLFFGAVDHVRDKLAQYHSREPGQKHLLLVASGINFIDVAGAEFLANEAKSRRREGGGLYFYRIKEGVCGPLKRGGYMDEIGWNNLFTSKTEAIGHIFERLDKDVCARCTRRIFRECASVERVE
ncbi:MAG: SulP family inorganic anion transporter [Chromatiales bacterium]|jgi:SulP family sulfate permease|nr:SulP family inorganic anion transporter [Chromatiales bacterium]MDX9766922.1 SulP family inorganic anion transporter [Ectothiorhodospiraceae bacterium]